jgi:Rod binding domain-containing protein
MMIQETPSLQSSLPGIKPGDSPEKILEAAKEFEAFFLSRYLEHMYEGMETDGLFGGGFGEKVTRSMMMDEYGKSMSESGGIGLARMIASEMSLTHAESKRGHNVYAAAAA